MNELTTREDMSLATTEVVGTSGDFDQSDYSIPWVKLVQASSEEVKDRKAQPGDFLSSDGDLVDHIDFVPLHIAFTRDFYDADGAKAICGSADRRTGFPRDKTFFAVNGDTDVVEGEPLSCHGCPFENWVSGKLACRKTYAITGYDLQKESPFMYRVRGSAMGVFKHRFVGATAMGRTKPWARSFQMTSAKKSNGGNSWFAPELQPTEGFTKEKQAEWEAYANGIIVPAEVEHVDADDLPFE